MVVAVRKIRRCDHVDPASLPLKWADFEWPEWVPNEQRKKIIEFWRESWGRSPQAWARDNKQQNTPATGSRVYASALRPGRSSFWVSKGYRGAITGTYLHCWNNMGRIVTDDGQVVVVAGRR